MCSSFGNRKLEAYSNQTTTPCATNANANLQYTVTNPTANNQVGGTDLRRGGQRAQRRPQLLPLRPEGRICAVASTPMPSMTTMTGYIYDASGTRVAKGSLTWTGSGTSTWNTACSGITGQGGWTFTPTTSWVLGLGGEQVTEINGAGAWQHINVYAGGKLLASYHDTNTYFNLTDWLGTKRVEYTPNGLHTSFFSLPYGDGLTPSGNAYDATEQHFTGKERDTESGNDYFGARYYSSAMGRWMSPDWSVKREPVPYAKLDDPQTLIYMRMC
jgi:RHS repeat-associated protein